MRGMTSWQLCCVCVPERPDLWLYPSYSLRPKYSPSRGVTVWELCGLERGTPCVHSLPVFQHLSRFNAFRWLDWLSDVCPFLHGVLKRLRLLFVHLDIVHFFIWGHRRGGRLWGRWNSNLATSYTGTCREGRRGLEPLPFCPMCPFWCPSTPSCQRNSRPTKNCAGLYN